MKIFKKQIWAIALLELMLATTILGIALVTLGVSVSRCLRGLSSAEYVQAAMDVAEDRLVNWRISMSKLGEVRPETFEGEKMVGPRKFSWKQVIETTEDPAVLKSNLTVKWMEGTSEQDRSFVLLVPKTRKSLK